MLETADGLGRTRNAVFLKRKQTRNTMLYPVKQFVSCPRGTMYQVLNVTGGSLDPHFVAARKNALINLAVLDFDAGHEDAAVAAYENFLR